MNNTAESKVTDEASRAVMLKEYVSRLSKGDSLEDVRKDFAAHFQSVDEAEIVKAEQALITGGTPIAEVQKLCDVHSALFHGATREEQIGNAEKAVQASVQKADDASAMTPLSMITGHPLSVFTAEDNDIAGRISEMREYAASGADIQDVSEKLKDFRIVTVHYAEKGDLLYPLLTDKYDVSGPEKVMWGVDIEIRDELRVLTVSGSRLPDFTDRLSRLLTRAEEMIYKENNILFPLCIKNFTEEDWMHIYYELQAYDKVLAGERPVWKEAEARRAELKENRRKLMSSSSDEDDMISLGSGHMTPPQIEAVLNTIPMELSFIDENDINRFFNDGTDIKLFKRPDDAVDREVYTCHPPKFAVMARQIINMLKAGTKDSVDIWITKRGEPVFVRYMAVRDKNGEYVGTLECVQKMGFAKEHFKGTAEQA